MLIVGHGRSGTNWLHGLLDLSPRTHCRNEPNELEGSPLAELHAPVVDPARDAELDGGWDRAVGWAAERLGERDPVPEVPKDHLRSMGQRLGLPTVVRRHRTRRVLGRLVPELGRAEWRMPRWLGSPRRLQDAVVVLKTLGVAGWVDWLVRRGRDVQILHCVRHPAGYLDSWSRRWLGINDRAEVARANRRRLREVLRVDPSWEARIGDVEALGAEESELWFWRYSTEAVHRAGRQHPRYRLVVYDRLAADPVGTLRAIYEDCRLPWTSAIEAAVRERSRESMSIATGWRRSLAPEHLELALRVCEGSEVQQWWALDEGAGA